jgi:hypothetical protein
VLLRSLRVATRNGEVERKCTRHDIDELAASITSLCTHDRAIRFESLPANRFLSSICRGDGKGGRRRGAKSEGFAVCSRGA